MVDRMTKNLKKFQKSDRDRILDLMRRVRIGDLNGLDVRKLKDRSDAFRVRKGDYRVIFRKTENGLHLIIAVERRSNTTYNEF